MREAAVLLAALATVPLIIAQEQGATGSLIAAADWLIWAVFAVDYVLGLAASERKGPYVRSNKLNAAVVIISFPTLPALLSAVRIARVIQLARAARVGATIVRALPILRAILGRQGFLYVASLTALIVITSGSLLAIIEPETVKGSVGSGVWWAVVTATTVGYGDIAPVTVPGRLIAIIVMLGGVSLISTLSASIAAYFVGQDSDSALARIEDKLHRIEQRLDDDRTEGAKR